MRSLRGKNLLAAKLFCLSVGLASDGSSESDEAAERERRFVFQLTKEENKAQKVGKAMAKISGVAFVLVELQQPLAQEGPRIRQACILEVAPIRPAADSYAVSCKDDELCDTVEAPPETTR